MVRFVHELPFWNPYSWAWSPLLADAQSGFWYPTNLLQIAIMWIFFPHAQHLPVLIPETMTLLHLPLAALGVFVLLRKEFKISGIAAFVAGLCWGFGVRMVAEQNHPMQILQLSLLPWETLLLMRSWKSWRASIAFGILFGISFFAGQPQTFFFFAIFFLSFSMAELVKRRGGPYWLQPLVNFAVAMAIAAGISAIQLLPTMELIGLSARQSLSYANAAVSGIHLGEWINFVIPKFFGEYPEFQFHRTPMVFDDAAYWEATFYWGILAEVLAIFAVVSRWRVRKRSLETVSRYLGFFVLFSLLALGYGMGSNFVLHWLFWKFVPFFNHIRAPNRMIWLLWFMGTLLTGAAINDIVRDPTLLHRHRSFLMWSAFIVLTICVASFSGLLDLLFSPHHVREGMRTMIAPSVLIAMLVAVYLWALRFRRIPTLWIVPVAVLLISGDLYYRDIAWYRNTLNREDVVRSDSSTAFIQSFRKQHGADHLRALELFPDSLRKEKANLGMFLRLPIEYGDDTTSLRDINPLFPQHGLPEISDSQKRMEIMGVTSTMVRDGIYHFANPLPFLKLYSSWRVGSEENILDNPSFDFQKMIVLSEEPQYTPGVSKMPDTATLSSYSENHMIIRASASQPSVLFINDLYYPAWQATVDGKQTKILRAFSSLRAVPVPAGVHTIEMKYESSAFEWGWKITVGTIIVSMFFLLIPRQKNKNGNQRS